MISGIYCIENKIDGKKYIGKSIDINRRWKSHINDLNFNKSECSYLQNAWNKYGEENFEFYVIEKCDINYLSEREIFHIKEKKSKKPFGYNLTDGGDGSTGYIPAKATLIKQSNSHKGITLSEKTKDKLRDLNLGDKNPFFNKKHSEETKKIISEKGMNRKDSLETLKKKSESAMGINNSIFGVKFRDSTSKFYGVSFSNNRYWTTQLRFHGSLFYISKFKEEIYSAVAYDMASCFYYKREGVLNFPEKREEYISYLNQYDILDIKDLRKVIKLYIQKQEETNDGR